MVDNITCACSLQNFYIWKLSHKVPLRWIIKADEDTGEIVPEEYFKSQSNWRVDKRGFYKFCSYLHVAKWREMDIVVTETRKNYPSGKETVTYRLVISGSMIASHYQGPNHGRLNFDDIQYQISLIENELNLEAEKLRFKNIEPLVDIQMSESPIHYLRNNLIGWMNKALTPFDKDKNGKCIGFHYDGAQRDHKIYDKSFQYNLPVNIMRFENHYKKMKDVNNLGIFYLSDLRDKKKVYSLLRLLLADWDKMFFSDDSIDINAFEKSTYQYDMLRLGNSAKYWQRLKKEVSSTTYHNRIKEFKLLAVTHGNNFHQKGREVIIRTWETAFNYGNELPSVENGEMKWITGTLRSNLLHKSIYKTDHDNNNMIVDISKREDGDEVSTILINNKTEMGIQNLNPGIEEKSSIPENESGNTTKRTCLACGADISMNRPQSKFCSLKHTGVKAKSCRAKISNRNYREKQRVIAIQLQSKNQAVPERIKKIILERDSKNNIIQSRKEDINQSMFNKKTRLSKLLSRTRQLVYQD